MHDAPQPAPIGIIGARSPIGGRLLTALANDANPVFAFSRQAVSTPTQGVAWKQLPPGGQRPVPAETSEIPQWIFIAHIWLLTDYFQMLEAHGAKRVVAISSTSQFTKTDSSVGAERLTVDRLVRGERTLRDWARERGIAVTILRPTLIYGDGRDRNISDMAKFIDRAGFFPLLGAAAGQRQPVHVEDVALACIQALRSPNSSDHDYTISGADVLSYRQIVERVFAAMGRRPRLVSVPIWAIKAGVGAARLLPPFKHWTVGMAERMNRDMIFDHADARRDFGFNPRPFTLAPRDVGRTQG